MIRCAPGVHLLVVSLTPRTILLPYARRSKSLDVLIPGISTGDFEAALMALLGKAAGGLSDSTVARLQDVWSRCLRSLICDSQNEMEITIGWCQVDGVGDDLAELISISRSRAEPASRVERGRLIQAHRRGDHCRIIGRFPGLNKGPFNALRRIFQAERGC